MIECEQLSQVRTQLLYKLRDSLEQALKPKMDKVLHIRNKYPNEIITACQIQIDDLKKILLQDLDETNFACT